MHSVFILKGSLVPREFTETSRLVVLEKIFTNSPWDCTGVLRINLSTDRNSPLALDWITTDAFETFYEDTHSLISRNEFIIKLYDAIIKQPVPNCFNYIRFLLIESAIAVLEKLIGDITDHRVLMINVLKHVCHHQCEFLNKTETKLKFKKQLNDLIQQEATHRFQSHKARIIQRAWKKAIVNPNTAVCRNRLIKEYNQLQFDFC